MSVILSGGKIVGAGIGVFSSGGAFQAPPTGVLITAQTASTASLAWTAASGATSYNVYRNGSLYAQPGNVTSYTDSSAAGTCSPTTFVPATIYAYYVTAVGAVESVPAYPAMYLYQNGVATQSQAEFSNGVVTTWNSTDVAVPQGTFSAKAVYAGGGGQFQPISQTPITPSYAMEVGAFNYCTWDVYLTDTSHVLSLGLISRPGGTSGSDIFNTAGPSAWINGGTSVYGTIGLNQWGTLKVPFSDLSIGISTFMGYISGTTMTLPNGLGSIISGPGPDGGGFITGAGVTAGTFISQNTPPLAGPFTLNNSMTVGSVGTPVLLTCQRTNFYKAAANATSGTTLYYNNFGFTTV